MKSRLRLKLIIGMLIFITISASAQKHIENYDPEALFNEGVLLFQNQEYGAALTAFTQYRAQAADAKSQRCVDAQYYESVSSLYLGQADGPSKVIRFVNDNPGSTWAKHANFLYANHLFKEKNTSMHLESMKRPMLLLFPTMKPNSYNSIWVMLISNLGMWIKPCLFSMG